MLVLYFIQGKIIPSESSRLFKCVPSAIEEGVAQCKASMGDARRAKPDDIRELYERQLSDLWVLYGEAMLELRARKNSNPCWPGTRHDRGHPAGGG